MTAVFRVLAVFGLVSAAAAASAQSLGDVATKERRRREQLQRRSDPQRVITETELATNGGRLANDPTDAPAVPPVAAPSPTTPGDSVDTVRAAEQQLERRWRAEGRSRRARMAAAEQAVQSAARWSDPTYAGPDRPSCPITRRRRQGEARAELEYARQSLDALADEARVAGALPGWIR